MLDFIYDYYYDCSDGKIKTPEQLENEFNKEAAEMLSDDDELSYDNFEDWFENALEWCDIIPLDDEDVEKLNSGEKCFFRGQFGVFDLYTETEVKELIKEDGFFRYDCYDYKTIEEVEKGCFPGGGLFRAR